MNHRGAALSHPEPHSDFRTFCEAAWAAPGVEAACLELQDSHGADVALALLGVWLAARGRGLDDALARKARAAAADWTPHVVTPLRAARRALKVRDGELYRAALALELDAERALLGRLDAIAADAPESGAEGLAEANLKALIGAAADGEAARRLVRAARPSAPGAQAGPGARMISEMEQAEALRQLHELRAEHRTLDTEIAALSSEGAADQLKLMRLKRQKLALKDQISQLEDEIRPDIIA